MDMIKNELDFYSKFARPLIFSLPEATDRALAAAWVEKIKNTDCAPEKLRTDYMKLLLFALQRKKLVGIFNDNPSDYEILEEFPPNYNLNTMARQLLEKEQRDRVNNITKQLIGDVDYPPYITDCSSDLKEYVAAQDIPNFGVHCYYALSKHPVTAWNKYDKGVFPKMAKSTVNATSSIPPELIGQRASDSWLKGQEKDEDGKIGKSLTDLPEDEADKKKRRRKKPMPGPPVNPLGTRVHEDTRQHPTWSSNLLQVLPQGDSVSLRPTSGAIPQFDRTDPGADFGEEFREVGKALQDFQRGEIREKKRKKYTTISGETEEEDIYEYDQFDTTQDFDDDLDLNESQFDEDINEDSLIVKYMKDAETAKSSKKGVDKLKSNISGTIPAHSGVPITTPKPSVSPQRGQAPEVHKRRTPIPVVTENELLESTLRSPENDPEMTKLYLQTSAAKEPIPEGYSPEYSYSESEKPQYQYGESYRQEVSQIQPVPRERMVPPGRGSPAANAIASDVISSLETGADSSRQDEYQSFDYELQPAPVFQTPPRIATRKREELPLDQEMRYIDFLFKDKETADLLKRVAHTVSDIEQDFPDPVNLVCPPSPPLHDVGPMSFLGEETLDFLVPTSPDRPMRQPTFPEDDRVLDFARGYVPPVYQSPPRRLGESPQPLAKDVQDTFRLGGVPRMPVQIGRPDISKSTSRLQDQEVYGTPSGGSKLGGIPRAAVSLPSSKTIIGRPTEVPSPQRRIPTTPRMYFPSSTLGMEEWPSPDANLVDALQRHQIDPSFYDPKRPKMRRRIVVGKTAGKNRLVRSKFVPPLARKHPIVEADVEGSPVRVRKRTPERAAYQEDSRMYRTPQRAFLNQKDDGMLEFARGYVPPIYQSPPEMLLDESPPHLADGAFSFAEDETAAYQQDGTMYTTPKRAFLNQEDDRMLEFARGYVPPIYQSPPEQLLDESPPYLADGAFSFTEDERAAYQGDVGTYMTPVRAFLNQDDRMLEFARGYVPPIYQSPPEVLLDESPPYLAEGAFSFTEDEGAAYQEDGRMYRTPVRAFRNQDDDKMLEFARGYVPPIYQSPPEGLLDESPPYLAEGAFSFAEDEGAGYQQDVRRYRTPVKAFLNQEDDRMLEFARGYVPPIYQSPPGLLGEESPPPLVEGDRRSGYAIDHRGGPTVDQRSGPSGSGFLGPGFRKYFADRREEGERHFEDVRRSYGLPTTATSRPAQRPKPKLPRKRLNFTEIDPNTEAYISKFKERHQDLPPIPPIEWSPPRMVTPPRRGLPGWDSPEAPGGPLPTFHPFYKKYGSHQLLDSVAPPFDDLDMSPTEADLDIISPTETDFDYFDNYTQEDDFGEDAYFFDTDVNAEDLLETSTELPYEYESLSTSPSAMPPAMPSAMPPTMPSTRSPEMRSPRSPEMSSSMQRMRETLQRDYLQTPPRRPRIRQPMKTIPPTPPDFDLPPIATYSPLSTGQYRLKKPHKLDRYKPAPRRDCCSFHRDM